MERRKITIRDLHDLKARGRRITMLTAFDYSLARFIDEAGIDMVLVGDSLAMVALGYESTVPVSMEEMLHHAKAVRRAVRHAFLVADMPFMSYNVTREQAIANAGRFAKEALADGVKLEGGREMAPTVRAVVEAGIPVLGHIGLTPQTVSKLSGYRVQGRDAASAGSLIDAALAIEAAGAFALVIEGVPAQLAEIITARLSIPTIGIGAGPGCDGQVLVTYDILGLFPDFTPRFAKAYARVGDEVRKALAAFRHEVEAGEFPSSAHSYSMSVQELEKLKKSEE
ncbi:MAG: 3-methyl-2-oxobutanoate hydroxymethyltransferase [Pseudomonadota bacterium]